MDVSSNRTPLYVVLSLNIVSFASKLWCCSYYIGNLSISTIQWRGIGEYFGRRQYLEKRTFGSTSRTWNSMCAIYDAGAIVTLTILLFFNFVSIKWQCRRTHAISTFVEYEVGGICTFLTQSICSFCSGKRIYQKSYRHFFIDMQYWIVEQNFSRPRDLSKFCSNSWKGTRVKSFFFFGIKSDVVITQSESRQQMA